MVPLQNVQISAQLFPLAKLWEMAERRTYTVCERVAVWAVNRSYKNTFICERLLLSCSTNQSFALFQKPHGGAFVRVGWPHCGAFEIKRQMPWGVAPLWSIWNQKTNALGEGGGGIALGIDQAMIELLFFTANWYRWFSYYQTNQQRSIWVSHCIWRIRLCISYN